jgi:predicted DNA binding CopG/RHH family protein
MKANKIREYKFENLLENNLKNKEFREEYQNLEKEFVSAEEVIKLRIKKNMTPQRNVSVSFQA